MIKNEQNRLVKRRIVTKRQRSLDLDSLRGYLNIRHKCARFSHHSTIVSPSSFASVFLARRECFCIRERVKILKTLDFSSTFAHIHTFHLFLKLDSSSGETVTHTCLSVTAWWGRKSVRGRMSVKWKTKKNKKLRMSTNHIEIKRRIYFEPFFFIESGIFQTALPHPAHVYTQTDTSRWWGKECLQYVGAAIDLCGESVCVSVRKQRRRSKSS